ncbi:MAG: hypothetical protein HWQ41_11610 [Nostoc sp. NOS(2021)]|uniref:hypothetical protein n=1 Tax=Nostoc sp. NOS(2021) TaxID=2815407 RepID=UPI0025FE20E2|nr:hypothetical protein [Nostoc sp. NOS(2021)]MBN3895878.1 hypothetical protein [Nostoc sp. NOS(2021)]
MYTQLDLRTSYGITNRRGAEKPVRCGGGGVCSNWRGTEKSFPYGAWEQEKWHWLVETIALSVGTMALSVETIALLVGTMLLSVGTMALSVGTFIYGVTQHSALLKLTTLVEFALT